MSNITAIMTGYERPQNMIRQFEAIKNQTHPADDIMMWYNQGSQPPVKIPDVKSAYSTHNFKFYGRFAFALLAQTEYICIFDDDTIPGEGWFDNCLKTMETHPGLLGTVGVVLHSDNYLQSNKFGWLGPNEEVKEVDLVGHAWFFKREWLKYLWMEEIPNWNNGEDIHFSHMLQKYGNIHTFVPPHPKENTSIWGSIDGHIGSDGAAFHRRNPDHYNQRTKCVRTAIGNGWTPLFMKK